MPFLTFGSGRLEYERFDAGAGTGGHPIVMLHEGLGSVSLWKDFPQRLAQATRCNVIVYSRPGFGKSAPVQQPRCVRYMHEEALVVLPQAIQGEEDEYGTLEQIRRIERAATHVETLCLAGCRHSPHRDQPQRVLEAVARWVSTVAV